MFARMRLPGRSPAFRRPRWYWTISVSSELWLDPTRCERRDSSRSRAWFIACSRSVRLAKVLVFIPPTPTTNVSNARSALKRRSRGPTGPPRKGGGRKRKVFSSDFDRRGGLEGRDGGSARTEHGDSQLPGEALEQAPHGLFAFRGGGEHGVGEAGQVRAEPKRLGGVEPVLQSAARDQR